MGAIKRLATHLLEQWSPAELSQLEAGGYEQALGWVEWAYRTEQGWARLEGFTEGQRQRIAHEVLDAWKACDLRNELQLFFETGNPDDIP